MTIGNDLPVNTAPLTPQTGALILHPTLSDAAARDQNKIAHAAPVLALALALSYVAVQRHAFPAQSASHPTFDAFLVAHSLPDQSPVPPGLMQVFQAMIDRQPLPEWFRKNSSTIAAFMQAALSGSGRSG